MKLRIFVLVILLIGHLQAVTVSTSRNPVLDYLKTQGVTIYTTPQIFKGSNNCRSEWQIYGTLCDQTSLATYASRDRTYLTTLSANFWAEVTAIKSSLDSIKSAATALKTRVESVVGPVGSNSSFLVTLKAFLLVSAKFLSYPTTMQDISKCNNKLISIRSAALCNTCSGRSQRYFTPNFLARFSLYDCNLVIDSCQTTWNAIIKILDSADALQSVIAEFKKFDPSFPSLSFLSITNMRNYFDRNGIKTNLANCRTNGTIYTCPAGSAQVICNNLIKLQNYAYPIRVSDVNTIAALRQESATVNIKMLEISSASQTSANNIRNLNKGALQTADGALWSRRRLQAPQYNITLPGQPGGVNVQTSNYTASAPTSSMDMSLFFP